MWKEVDEARYNEMLGMMWPALWLDKGFLVGEPFDHRSCSQIGRVLPTYAAFIQHNDKFFEGSTLTVPEFRVFDVKDLPP